MKQLNPYMKELVPHDAEIASLEVIGRSLGNRGKTQRQSDVEIHFVGKNPDGEITDNVQIDDEDENDPTAMDSFRDRPDVAEPSLMGPALKIDTFVFQQMASVNENEELDFIYEIRVQFDSQVKESVTRMVEIKNVGTTVFYYEWQQKPYTKPFDIVNSKTQRFYFDNRTSNYPPIDRFSSIHCRTCFHSIWDSSLLSW